MSNIALLKKKRKLIEEKLYKTNLLILSTQPSCQGKLPQELFLKSRAKENIHI